MITSLVLSSLHLEDLTQPCSFNSARGCRIRRGRRQCATTDLSEIPQMRCNVWNVQGCSNVRIVPRWWLKIRGGHHFLVVVVLIDIIGSHRNIVARLDVPLRPDMMVAEGRQTFNRETGHGIVDVGDTEIIAHSLSRNVPSEEVVSDSWGSFASIEYQPSTETWARIAPTRMYTGLIRGCSPSLEGLSRPVLLGRRRGCVQ